MSIFEPFVADYARRERHRTATTYHTLLSQFERWLGERQLKEFDEAHVLEFLDEKGWANTSKNTFLAGIRGWAKAEKARVPSGATLEEMQRYRDVEKRLERIASLKDFKAKHTEKDALPPEQISMLFDVMDPKTASLFWVLLWTGVRVGELATMEPDFERGRLVVHTEKSEGTRVLFMDEYTGRLLRHCMDTDTLYQPPKKIWKMLRKYSHYCAPTKLGPHICRHTFASRFAMLTDRDTLRKMLGHGAKDVTDLYVHVDEARVREVMLGRHYLKPLEPEGGGKGGA